MSKAKDPPVGAAVEKIPAYLVEKEQDSFKKVGTMLLESSRTVSMVSKVMTSQKRGLAATSFKGEGRSDRPCRGSLEGESLCFAWCSLRYTREMAHITPHREPQKRKEPLHPALRGILFFYFSKGQKKMLGKKKVNLRFCIICDPIVTSTIITAASTNGVKHNLESNINFGNDKT